MTLSEYRGLRYLIILRVQKFFVQGGIVPHKQAIRDRGDMECNLSLNKHVREKQSKLNNTNCIESSLHPEMRISNPIT
jgi:hypothetical protein